MKLFVKDTDGIKIPLSIVAQNRKSLADHLGSNHLKVEGRVYSLDKVFAEKSIDNTAVGMAAGGVLGVAGGPAGVIFGGIVGGLFGKKVEDDEQRKVTVFNESIAG